MFCLGIRKSGFGFVFEKIVADDFIVSESRETTFSSAMILLENELKWLKKEWPDDSVRVKIDLIV